MPFGHHRPHGPKMFLPIEGSYLQLQAFHEYLYKYLLSHPPDFFFKLIIISNLKLSSKLGKNVSVLSANR
jgi:hypothetical protein